MYFTEINKTFLSTGHRFLSCYCEFALIEKQKKTTVKVLVEMRYR